MFVKWRSIEIVSAELMEKKQSPRVGLLIMHENGKVGFSWHEKKRWSQKNPGLMVLHIWVKFEDDMTDRQADIRFLGSQFFLKINK